MKIVKKGLLKFPDQREVKLALFKVEEKVFRWAEDPSGRLLNGIDYLSEHDAIKGVRYEVECDPAYVGVDFTVYPVEPSPDERATRRIIIELHGYPAGAEETEAYASDSEKVARIIREETAIDKLTEAINLLITYEFPRRLQPKRAGLDMTWGGLALGVIEALEVSSKTDLSNLKKQLTQGVEQVKVYSVVPGSKEVN